MSFHRQNISFTKQEFFHTKLPSTDHFSSTGKTNTLLIFCTAGNGASTSTTEKMQEHAEMVRKSLPVCERQCKMNAESCFFPLMWSNYWCKNVNCLLVVVFNTAEVFLWEQTKTFPWFPKSVCGSAEWLFWCWKVTRQWGAVPAQPLCSLCPEPRQQDSGSFQVQKVCHY